MADQRTATDDPEAPPPMAAVAAARRAEMEDARDGAHREDRNPGPSIFIGVVVVILAALSMIIVLMAG